MIPKVIHYCWFGGNEKTELIRECIKSWKKYMPDYEIIEWNETNFDINSNLYVAQAYKAKKWAFVSDYARLYAIYNFGGIYFDTDVEVIKPMDDFIRDEAFTGFESKDSPVTAIMGAEKGHILFKELLEHYKSIQFINDDGTYNMVTNTHIITDYLVKNGIKKNGKEQEINGFKVYPAIYFCPNNFSRIFNITSKKSYTIHHFDQSWRDKKRDETKLLGRIRRYIVGVLRDIAGTDTLERIKKTLKF
ncbi:MAG: glycosyl transferase [Ruminococcus sp.]|nr:glycosyl transferase [Ruminococcus sp.]